LGFYLNYSLTLITLEGNQRFPLEPIGSKIPTLCSIGFWRKKMINITEKQDKIWVTLAFSTFIIFCLIAIYNLFVKKFIICLLLVMIGYFIWVINYLIRKIIFDFEVIATQKPTKHNTG